MKLIRMIGHLGVLLSARRRKQEAKKKQLMTLWVLAMAVLVIALVVGL